MSLCVGHLKFVFLSRYNPIRVVAQRSDILMLICFQPILIEVDSIHLLAEIAEWVNVFFSLATPIHKLYTELESRFGFAHKVAFVNAQGFIKETDVG